MEILRNSRTYYLIISALGIVLNIVLGTLVASFKIPLLFLDTIGTIFVAVLLGPFYGAAAGGLTNIIQGMITNPKTIPFAIVNIAIGLIVGYIAKKYKFNYKVAIFTGIIISVIAPLIGTPIAVYVYGGLTGGGTDLIFAWLLKSGKSIFTAAFIPRICGNLIDKIASTLIVVFLLDRLSIVFEDNSAFNKSVYGENDE